MSNVYKNSVYNRMDLHEVRDALRNREMILAKDLNLIEVDFVIIAMLKNGGALQYLSDSNWIKNYDVVAAAYAEVSNDAKGKKIVVKSCKGLYTEDELKSLAEEKYPDVIVARTKPVSSKEDKKEDKKVGVLQKIVSFISKVKAMLFSNSEKNSYSADERVENGELDPLRSSDMNRGENDSAKSDPRSHDRPSDVTSTPGNSMNG